MKKAILSISALALCLAASAQLYVADSCKVSFFSETPVENIDATNTSARPILNTATGDIQIKIDNKGFTFVKPLMQEHFNENYMESDKFPHTIFKGKINEKVDYTKDGVTPVTVTGKMDMHGVTKEVTLKGTVTVRGQKISIASNFMIHIADYKITIPTLVVKNIAEDVMVKMNASLKPFVKK